MRIILVFILFTFVSCASNRSLANVHHERIETQMQAVPIRSDTIEIEYRLQSTNNRYSFPTDSTDNTDIFYPPDLTMRSRLRRNRATDNTDFNAVRIKSTRALNIESRHTDTTQTLRITLRPDTVYVPYMTHIRSDTIVAPDPTVQAKLTSARWKMALLIIFIILILVIKIRRIIN